MSKRLFKNILAVVIVLLLLVTPVVTMAAEDPFESYTYWSDVGSMDRRYITALCTVRRMT